MSRLRIRQGVEFRAVDLKRIQQELRYGKKKRKKGREEINKNVAERLPVELVYVFYHFLGK